MFRRNRNRPTPAPYPPIQVRRTNEWTDEDRGPIVARTPDGPPANFVAPGPPARPVRVEILPAAQPIDVPAGRMVKAQSVTSGDHLDRARGFGHITGRLALAMGGLGVLVAVVGFKQPLFSLTVLGWFGTMFVATWLAAYLVHVFISPEGTAFLDSHRHWGWQDREQAHRHSLERFSAGMDDREGRRR